MNKKLPVTVITGFLGAGKTTLINALLHQPHEEKIAVIVNEYGDVGVDHQLVVNVEEEIFQMNNGCICCTLRTDLTNMLHTILTVKEEQSIPIERIVLETTGLAELGPIAQTFMRTPFLQEHFEIDSVLTLVDAVNALHQIAHYEESVDQIAFADKMILTKVDYTSKQTISVLKKKLRHLNSFAVIEELDLNEVKVKDFFGLELFNKQQLNTLDLVEENAANDSHEHDHDHSHSHPGSHQTHCHDHEHTEGIVTLSLKTNYPIHPALIDMWMNELIMTFGMDLLRYKGVLHLYGDPNKIIYQGVNMSMKAERGERWSDKGRASVLVFIGKNLPIEEMKMSFQKCVMNRELMEELNFTEETIKEVVGDYIV